MVKTSSIFDFRYSLDDMICGFTFELDLLLTNSLNNTPDILFAHFCCQIIVFKHSLIYLSIYIYLSLSLYRAYWIIHPLISIFWTFGHWIQHRWWRYNFEWYSIWYSSGAHFICPRVPLRIHKITATSKFCTLWVLVNKLEIRLFTNTCA